MPKKTISIVIDEPTYVLLTDKADVLNKTFSAIVRQALKDYLIGSILAESKQRQLEKEEGERVIKWI